MQQQQQGEEIQTSQQTQLQREKQAMNRSTTDPGLQNHTRPKSAGSQDHSVSCPMMPNALSKNPSKAAKKLAKKKPKPPKVKEKTELDTSDTAAQVKKEELGWEESTRGEEAEGREKGRGGGTK